MMFGNKKIITIVIILVGGFIFYGLWQSAFGYFDLFNFCSIKINHNAFSKNTEPIEKAISLLKKTDKTSYNVLCKYVDHIYERPCVGGDWHLTEISTWDPYPGCYVRGTKSIYLAPTTNRGYWTIEQKTETLKQLADFSKDFWR